MTNPNLPFLEPIEIRSMTDKMRRRSQIKVLRALGVDHKVRPDGSIAILRAHIVNIFGGNPTTTKRTTKNLTAGPNWAAI